MYFIVVIILCLILSLFPVSIRYPALFLVVVILCPIYATTKITKLDKEKLGSPESTG